MVISCLRSPPTGLYLIDTWHLEGTSLAVGHYQDWSEALCEHFVQIIFKFLLKSVIGNL